MDINSSCAETPAGSYYHWDEAARLAALDRYGILDSGRERGFDDIAELAADILNAPIAVVNFIAADRQWFKAEKGIGADTLPLDVSICRYAILQPGVFVVPDLTRDARFEHNPLVNVADGLRFYAGALLETPDGLPLGTVCVLDTVARPGGISNRQARALKALAGQTMAQLELRRSGATARQESARLAAMFAQATVGMSEITFDGRFVAVNDRLCEILGRSRDEILTLGVADVTHHDDVVDNMAKFADMAVTGRKFMLDKRYVRPDGTIVWANSSISRLHDENGRPRAALVVTADITARKAEDRHRAFLLALSDRTKGLADGTAVIAAVSRALGEEIGANRVAYAEIDEPGDRAMVVGEWNDGGMASMPTEIRVSDFGAPIVDHLCSGQTLRVTDAAAEPGFAESITALDAISARAIVSVPLFKDGHFVVNLNVHQNVPRRWTDAEVAMIEAVAERTWDVVERARAAKRLQSSEAHLSAIFEQSTAGLSESDATGRFVRVNDRFCAIAGRTRAELLGLRMHDLTHSDDLVANAPLFAEVASGGAPFEIVKRYLRPDGGVVWVHNSVTVLRGPDGRPGNIVCVTVDITERQQFEAALRALNADLERKVVERTRERGLIWQHSLDLLSVIDLATDRFDAVNPAWSTALGWATDEFEGCDYADFVNPEDIDASAEAFAQVQRGNPVLHFENRYRTRAGGWRWLSWVAVPEAGKLYSVTRDVTVERERRAELQAAQEALRQSQKMEAMGLLTGGVAHDFNNLLTPIVGALDMLLRKGVGSEREQRLIAGAMQSAERAATLVQRLLAFARRQPLQLVPVDLAELVTGMGDLVESTTGPQIKVVVEAPGDLPAVLADRNQLEMALLNLAVNARDAMPDGGTLRISTRAAIVGPGHRSRLPPGEYVRLSVADTGAGMDEATLARAVEPFFSTKGVGKGTGLGLSMVHGLASQLGGVLTIQSRPGLGTNVELWLTQSAAAPEVAIAARDAAIPSLTRGTALLVDDEELVRMSTADMLTDLGYVVIEAASGEEAIRRIARGERFDLLVTDHLMPGITGVDLARTVRSSMPALPVLLVSGYAEREGVAPDLPRLVKPFRKDQLAASLAELTRG